MKGIVARFRHGPKEAEKGDLRIDISKEGKIVLAKQGEALAHWLLEQKRDKTRLKQKGVTLHLFHSGVLRARTSADYFARGFIQKMSRHGVNVTAKQPVKVHALRVVDNWDFAAMARLKKSCW